MLITRRISPWARSSRASTPSVVYSSLLHYHQPNNPPLLFFFDDIHQSLADEIGVQRLEAETSATRLQGGNDFTHIVANETEARIFAIFLNNYAMTKDSPPILRRRANWAAFVILSASSRIMSFVPVLNSFWVPAKFLIWSRTTSIPRSSDAFNYV